MNTLAALRPDLAAQWHLERNGDLTPTDVKPASNKRVWWRCPRCHEWQSVIADRTRAKGRCPYCAGQRPTAERNLAVLYPSVAAEWHPTRNGDLIATDVPGRSHRAAWWRCASGHEWRAVIASRTASKHGCPYCAGTRVTSDRNLEVLYPALAAEWHPTRNGAAGPRDAFPFAGKKVWFLTTDNVLVEATVRREVVRSVPGGARRDYTLLLFSKDLPVGIEPLRVVAWSNLYAKYPRCNGAPYPIFKTEQGGNVSAEVPGFSLNTWKGGDSGSPDLLPLPGELVFLNGRSTSGPSAQMQADMDTLCALENLNTNHYQLQWVDLSAYPSLLPR